MDGTTVIDQRPALAAGRNISDLTQKYIALRDKVDEIKKAQAKQLEPYGKVMEQLEGVLMKALNDAGVDSMKSDCGTIYRSTSTSVSVKDWPATFGYIKEHEKWDLLEARVGKTAVIADIQETGKPVPGVQISQASVLRVRRS